MSEIRYCQATGKRCFTEREAGEHIKYFRNTRYNWHNRGKTIPCRKYYCKECKSYHLTHLKKLKV